MISKILESMLLTNDNNYCVDGVNYDQPTYGDFSISVYNEILMPKKLR